MTPIVGLILALAAIAPPGDGPAPPGPVDFDREIRPIFTASCVSCHGPKKQKGGLALHEKRLALAGGDDGGDIIPGKGAESRLVRYASGLDDDHVMPPEGSGDPLKPDQVDHLRAWIDQGATWPEATAATAAQAGSDHWAFRRPIRPLLPPVRDAGWARNEIDRFVLARLEADGSRPSTEAGRATLIRRASLDLVGLAPSIAEVDAFVADPRPDAYERLVDRLIASPRYGERWARRWLDAARYADTNGYEKDRERSIWPYRDWVIRALNADLPFDRFTVEQIAGDLLPASTVDQRVATGFHRNTMINEEGGIDVEEFRFASLVDRVATTGAVWLGVTMQCAQCHTHKYDPITQRDYYRFLAFLDNVDEPEIPLPDPAIAARREAIGRQIESLRAALPSRFPNQDSAPTWEVLAPRQVESREGTRFEIRPDGSVLALGEPPASDTYEAEFDLDPAGLSALKVEALVDPSLPHQGPGRAPNGNFVLREVAATVRGATGDSIPLKSSSPVADAEQPGFPAAAAIDGKAEAGWAVDVGAAGLNRDHALTFAVGASTLPSGPARLAVKLDQTHGGGHTLGRFRVSAGRVPTPAEGEIETRRAARLDSRLVDWERSIRPTRWESQIPSTLNSARGATLRLLPDRSVLATGDKPNNDVYRVEIPTGGRAVTAIRLEVLTDPSLPGGGPGRAPLYSVGNFLLTDVQAAFGPAGGETRPIAIRDASADFAEEGRAAAQAIDADRDTGWSIGGRVGESHAIVFRLAEPTPALADGRLQVVLTQFHIHQTTIGRFRVSTTTDPNPPTASGLPAAIEDVVLVPPASRTAEQARALRRHFLGITPELAGPRAEIAALVATLPEFPTSMVLRERPPAEARTTRIRRRGEFLQATEAVTPGVPGVLHPLPEGQAADRLALARWLVAEDNPLVGRVVMNRAWQAFFGRGIVATLDDLGVRGAKPTHPELLDWLATELVRSGWSQKAMHRLIATSATYRQASGADPAAIAADPLNERLARGPRFRVDAELIRDLALGAADLLDGRVGGPSVFPPQPEGVAALSYGQAGWPTSVGPDRYRRGLYTYAKRTAPFAASTTFDGPTTDLACTRRERSNTPLQALTLLNDPALLEAARGVGRRIVADGPAEVDARVDYAYRLILGRPPLDEERAIVARFHAAQHDRLATGGLDPAAINGESGPDPAALDRAAWSIVARALLNLDEAISKE